MDKHHSCLIGKESFMLDGQPAGFSVIDFWQFQFSNIWDMQDQIAEFIVARALGQTEPYNKNGWTLWDINYKGRRIEVKETAYYHSWRSDGKVSAQRTFGITKSYSRYKDPTSAFKRQSDIYVFCLNTGETKETSNPLIWTIGDFGSCLQILSTSSVATIRQFRSVDCKTYLV